MYAIRSYYESVEVTGYFNLVLVYNRGAAFSFLADAPGWQTVFFSAVAIIASAIVSVMLLRAPQRRVQSAGLALILGGALGNLWDRLQWGAVADFLDFHAYGWHWPAFNVADRITSYNVCYTKLLRVAVVAPQFFL